MTQEQDELDAYFWKRTRIIILVLPLVTVAGLWPYNDSRFNSVRYHSDKTAAVVTGKKEEGTWLQWLHVKQDGRYLVTYDYMIEDEKFTTTEDMGYRECFDAAQPGQQIYIYFDREHPTQSYSECHLNRLTGSKQ